MVTRHRPAVVTAILATIAICLTPSILHAATAWEIDTYGNGAMLTAVFQGIALFASSGGGMIGALKLAALVGLLILLVSSTAATLTGAHALHLFPYAAIVAGVIGTLATISVPIAVVDKVVASSVVIDGVPLPIAIAGYFTSTLGSRIVDRVEQAMMPVDAERFMTHGLGWGPRVMQATLDTRIQDPVLLHDLTTYIEVCVSESFNTGYKTVNDLSHGTTAEQILGDTNPAIPFILPSQTNPPNGQTCPDAWNNVLKPKFTEHATSQGLLGTLALRLGLPSYSGVTSAIDDIMPTYQISQSAVDLLQTRFAVNQLLPSLQAMSALGNQSGMVTAWALAEAQAQQTSSWLTMGLLLQQTLPVFYSALEFLFYGFLVIGIPMLIVMPRLLISTLQTALFIQLWPLAYVFGNLFLYTQVSKLAFFTGDSNQGLGLSLAATQPLNEGIQNAYAASGFPILIGILILSGMIYGGGYALQRGAMMGPWTAGGAFGSAAALGNLSFGNVSHDNLSSGNVSRHNIAYDNLSRGNVSEDTYTARTQTFGTSAGTVSLSTGRGGAIGTEELHMPFGDVRFDSHSGKATALGGSALTMQTTTQATAEGGNALNFENAKVQQSAKEVQHAKASNLTKSFAVTASADQSQQHGISEGTRHAFQEAASHEIGKGLQSGEVGQEISRHFLGKGASASAGLKGGTPELLGFSIGAGGQIDVHSQFQNGQEVTTRLSRETSDRVLSQAHQSLERGTEYRQLNEETTRHGETSSQALGFDDVRRSTESYNEAVSKRESAAATLRATQAFSAAVGVNRGHLFLNALWEARNPGVNFAQAVREDRPSAASFSAELAAAAQSPAKLEELSKEALGHLEKTGQLTQYTGTSAAIEAQRPAAPSTQPLVAPINPLTGSGYQEPTPPPHGTITGRVDKELQQVGGTLTPAQQALSTQANQLEQLSGQQLKLGLDTTRAKTDGGTFTAGKEVGGEVLSGPAALANSVIKGIQNKKPDEQGGSQAPKAQ